MNKPSFLQTFTDADAGTSVRTLIRDGEPWFVAADVCKALTIGNTSQALNRLDSDEHALISNEGGI